MVPGQRIRQSWKVRDLPQGDGKTLYFCVEQQEITKDHLLLSLMRSPRDVHKSGPGESVQVLQHVHIIFQGIRQGPRLSISCYPTEEGGVDPLSPLRRGHRNVVQTLGQR